MRVGRHITVIIPAHNEEASIGAVLDDIPSWVDECIVVDNRSHDKTRVIALAHGAHVVPEHRLGYGAACLAGIQAANKLARTDILVFLDADFSDVPSDMQLLVDPIVEDHVDMTVSDRTALRQNRPSFSFAQFYGNRLACWLIRLRWRYTYHDLGPFRVLHRNAYEVLDMSDKDYGWTVEMQIRAVKRNLTILEVPVRYRERLTGKSKISGTITGVIKAGAKILHVIFREAFQR